MMFDIFLYKENEAQVCAGYLCINVFRIPFTIGMCVSDRDRGGRLHRWISRRPRSSAERAAQRLSRRT